MYKEEKITQIQDLIDIISKQVRETEILHWFRGQHNADWSLTPNIWRDYDNADERIFVHRYRCRAYSRGINMPEMLLIEY